MQRTIMRVLIISPQAGFGNRIRAINSAIQLAVQTGRTPLLYWDNTTPSPPQEWRAHVRALHAQGFHSLFPTSKLLPVIPATLHHDVDVCCTEWQEGEFWYPAQSCAQKAWNVPPQRRAPWAHAAQAAASDAAVVLLETSLVTAPTTHAIYAEWFMDMPRAKPATLAVCMRRGADFTTADPARTAAIQLAFVEALAARNRTAAVFITSDDKTFETDARTRASTACNLLTPIDHPGAPAWFKDFLTLASCATVIGTQNSSFPEEAATFGGNTFVPYMSP